ncbi:K02A2.6-like [Cordylochernes scorpioides]|uniref:K02A2.6-like n=1 Tax=Cordylochernes scorpioides TaxID=51811 RepID=A0ABY6LUD9_9ARAC|nr:K02A2.6-like [Cordylochernes scorpioides]
MTKLELELNGYKESIICQIDTGATVNVLNFADLCKSLKPSYIKLRCYGGEILKPRGQIKINCSHQSKQHPIVFQVIDHWEKPILSAETCQKLNLIEIKADLCKIESTWTKQNNLLDKYKDIFEGIGCLQGEYKLETDPTIKPIKQAPRRVPIILRKELKEKLIDMEKKNIIAKVDYPTDWISNLVLVKSTKKLRICIDPRELNVALKRAEYPIPTIEEIIPNLQNAKIFTVVDTKDGFWNVKLSDESSNLTTFWTPFGRYKFLRMPFGLKTASEEYQRRLYEIFQGDSYEEALKDHDRNLENLFKKARQANLKFNINKVKLRLKEVKYLGHIITPHGLKPDPENEPLRKLTMKNSTWSWSKNHQAAFEQIKDLASKAPILRYFDADKSIAIQCDASKHGLGATLLQESQPIIFASRSLSKTEQNYAQIEKECLAIVFACERFHQYILGKCQVIVQTDHKPLLSIFKKSILKAPQRLQRMLLRLQRYNLELEHVQGSQMHLADIFSRACIKDVRNENLKYDVYPIDIIYKEIATVNVMETLSVCSDTVLRIREETSSDPILCEVKKLILNGWPPNKNQTSMLTREYWNFREELTVQDGIILKNDRIVIPNKLRAEMIMKTHQGHIGINSNFFEVECLENTTSEYIIECCKIQFSRYGIPQIVVSDNGRQFTSTEFQKFSKEWQFQHSTSSPLHSQGNGKAEAAVKIAKNILKKSKQENNIDSSPVQRIMSRRTRAILPIHPNLLKPSIPENIPDKISIKRQQAKYYYDRKSKNLPDLDIGQEVYVRTPNTTPSWSKANITNEHNTRSYDVNIHGRTYRRNRTWIRPQQASANQKSTNNQEEGRKESIDQEQTVSNCLPSTSAGGDNIVKRTRIETTECRIQSKSDSPTVSEPENAASETRTRSGRLVKKPTDDLKWRAVGRMEAGQSQVEVAKWLNVNKSVVSKIWKQFIETGTIKRKEGSGRKRKTATSEDRYLVVTAKRHREMTAIQLSNELSSATGTRISRQTVYRRLHEGAFYARRPMVCIPLTSAYRRARLNWCLEHHAWTHDQWANVLFSDESRFSLNTDSRRGFVWREPGTRYHPSNIREIDSFRGDSLLVWAGISSSKRTPLHIFSGGTLTAQRYRDEILEPYLRPYRDQIGHNLVFMDDNARPHRARLVNEYLQSENIRRMDWPARYPDLNPIEHVWDALGRRIGARHPSPRTLVELRTALLEEWGLLPWISSKACLTDYYVEARLFETTEKIQLGVRDLGASWKCDKPEWSSYTAVGASVAFVASGKSADNVCDQDVLCNVSALPSAFHSEMSHEF